MSVSLMRYARKEIKFVSPDKSIILNGSRISWQMLLPCRVYNKSERGIIMAIIKEQDKKNEKEEKSLQTGKDADKFPLDDDLLDDVAGGRKSAVSPQIKDPFANPGLTN